MSHSSGPLPLPSRSEVETWRWIDEHLAELVQKYPDQWIAVYDKGVIAAGPSLGEVTATARQQCESDDIVYEFIHSGALIV